LDEERQMSDITNLAAAWSRAWSEQDTDAFLALFAPDAVYRDDQVGRLSRTHAELRDFHAHFVAALSDIRLEFRKTFQSGDYACLEWKFSGRQTGVYHGRPPSGIEFRAVGVSVLTLAPDGKIRECTDYYDSAVVARQLGAGT
jgi:steroid delta-isomerase-like uncharacterized protein